MRRFRYCCGVFLIWCALVALAAPSVVGSYVGGSASYGSIEDGRYFVGGHSVHKEVSEFEWWLELRVSQSFPWATLVPGFLGSFSSVRPCPQVAADEVRKRGLRRLDVNPCTETIAGDRT